MALQDSLNTIEQVQNKISLERTEVIEYCNEMLGKTGLEGDALIYVRTIALAVCVVIISAAIWWVTRKILLQIVHTFAARSKTKWDDYLVSNKFFSALAHLMPLIFMDRFLKTVFIAFPRIADFGSRLVILAIIYTVMFIIIRFLNAARDVLKEKPALKDKPIASFFQLGKIVAIGVLCIFMISVALGVNVIDIFLSLGAATAVLLLVFKDTILGFVGSIQLAANDMIRIGDWVTMEKYGADGDVLEINLTTVKVRNFDMTITTIPTYSFISDSFKNWRGMQESGGRRLMRGISIKIETVKFCTADLLNKLEEIELIRSYIQETENEILEYNKTHVTNRSVLLNGRNQTNIGIFRYYVKRYLEENEHINPNMTLMVRQLPATEKGVQIQIYAFTKTKVWAEYEVIMADIFDHLMAAIPFFELEVFENPTGSDMRQFGRS